MTTFAQVLARLLAADPGRPLVTFYDGATDERTELSVTTYATWVAKASSLLADELDLEAGDRLLVDLPPHWLGPVVLGAAWTVGLEVVWDGDHDAVVTGPDGIARWAAEAGRAPVVASALLPLAGPFPEGVPPGVHDLGTEVWSQPDSFVAWPGADDDTPAVAGVAQAELWAGAAMSGTDRGDRVLSELNPASAEGLPVFTDVVSRQGSLVLVVGATAERRARIARDERVTGP